MYFRARTGADQTPEAWACARNRGQCVRADTEGARLGSRACACLCVSVCSRAPGCDQSSAAGLEKKRVGKCRGRLRRRGRGARRFELIQLVSYFPLSLSFKSYCIVGRGLDSLLSWWRRGSGLKQSSGRARYSLAPGAEWRGAPPALRCKGAGLGAPGTARRRGCPQGWGIGHPEARFPSDRQLIGDM